MLKEVIQRAAVRITKVEKVARVVTNTTRNSMAIATEGGVRSCKYMIALVICYSFILNVLNNV